MKTRREFLGSAAAGGIAGMMAAGAAPAFARYSGRTQGTVSMEDARAVHDRMLIIDGHNDMPVERVARGEEIFNWMERDTAYHTDIPRMREGGYDVGFFIVGNGNIANVWVTTERLLSQIEQYPDILVTVLSAEDARRTQESGRIGLILSIEGLGRWLDGNVDTLRIFHRLGVRLAGITHGEGGSEPHFLQGSRSPYSVCTPQDRLDELKNASGLTPFGKDILRLSNELGMLTDLSHINDRAYFDVLELSETPPIMSHTAVFELCNHHRCLTDDQIRELAAKGGVMGIAFAPQFIDTDPEKATIDRLVEHICHVGDLVGIEYVGIGTDFDGLGRETIPVVPESSQLVHLTRSMMAHGLTEDEISMVWGGNFLRLIRQTIG